MMPELRQGILPAVSSLCPLYLCDLPPLGVLWRGSASS